MTLFAFSLSIRRQKIYFALVLLLALSTLTMLAGVSPISSTDPPTLLSWNPNVSCTPIEVTIEQILGTGRNAKGGATLNGSAWATYDLGYVDAISNNVYDIGETIVNDVNRNLLIDEMHSSTPWKTDKIVSVTPYRSPTQSELGQILRQDKHIKHIDGAASTNFFYNETNGSYDSGETLVYDANLDEVVDAGDTVVSVTPPRAPIPQELGKTLLTVTFGGVFNKRDLDPPCTITNAGGEVISTFVQVNNVQMISAPPREEILDCSQEFNAVNGGGPFPDWDGNGAPDIFCDTTPNLHTAGQPSTCTSTNNLGCPHRIHVEIDHNWKAARYCGAGTVCDNSTLHTLTTTTLIDVQGFVFWDPDHTDSGSHGFSGWELHPFTAWRKSPPPAGSFQWTPTSPSPGQQVTFNGSAAGIANPTFTWDFGDGELFTSNSPIAKHAFASWGVYIVTLTVTDNTGASVSHSEPVIVATSTADSWNPNVPCRAVVMTLEQIRSGSLSNPGTPNRRQLNQQCSVAGGPFEQAFPIFVQINGIKRGGGVSENDWSTAFATINGGGPYPTGAQADSAFSIYNPAYAYSCTDATDINCAHRLFMEIDRDWKAASYCGPGTVCDNSTLKQQTAAGTTYIDFQGFLLWNAPYVNATWHSLTGWEIHPVTAWRVSSFNLTTTPTTLFVEQESSGNATVSIDSLNGFAGNVSLTASVFPTGPAVSVGLTSLNLASGGSNSTTLTVNPGLVSHGIYTLVVNATSGTIYYSTTLTLVVSPLPNDPPTLAVPAEQTVNEGSLLSLIVNSSDTDVGQNVTLSASGLPSGAIFSTLTGNPVSGILTWTPSEAHGPGNFTITFSADDSRGGVVLRQTVIHVLEVNNFAPVLGVVGDKSVAEETSLTFTAEATDDDLPANTLTFSLGPGAPDGTSITPSGVFSWTPTEAHGPGNYSLTIIVSDETLTDSETITVTVGEVNVAPVLDPIGNKNASEETLVTFTSTATDADIPANTLTFSLGGGIPGGASINAATGMFTWTPSEGQGPESYIVTIFVFDGSLFDSETITITVNEVNRQPTLNPIGDRSVDENNTLSFLATATDPDIPANQLTFSIGPGAPPGASISLAGLFSWTPSEADGPGGHSVTIIVSDGTLADNETMTITVREVNSPPELVVPGPKTVEVGQTLTFNVSATDPDIPGNTITLACDNCTAIGATFNSTTGQFSFTPTPSQEGETYLISFTAQDDGLPSLSDTKTVRITVALNNSPELTDIGDKTVDEETLLTFNATATDPDTGQTLTFSLGPTSPSGASITEAGVFSWTPTEDQGPGNYTISVIVTDNLGGTDSETLTGIVAEVNKPPELSPIGGRFVNEETELTFTVTASDNDYPPQPLTFSLASAGTGAFPEGATITAQGVFAWTPTELQGPGTYNVRIQVSDGLAMDFENITITVGEVNRPPQTNTPGNLTVDEEAQLTFTVSATDPDVPSQTLTLSAPSLPSGASFDPVTGLFSWTPTEAQGPGSYLFTFRAYDGALYDTENMTITVNEVNKAPVIEPIPDQNTSELSNFTVSPIASDPDVPAQTLAYSLSGNATGVSVNPTTGEITWFPTESQGPGIYNVIVTVTDSLGAVTTRMFIVTVLEVNSPPVVTIPESDEFETVNEGTLIAVTVSATDLDDPPNAISLSVAGLPEGAAFDPATGSFSWTPSQAQGPGDYTISFTATDNGIPSLSVTLSITIHVNEPPVLGEIADRIVDENTVLTFIVNATDADMPPQTLTFSLVGAPPGATIDSTTGYFSWTIEEDQGPAVYTIQVTVTDGFRASDSKTLTITLNEVNQAPFLEPVGDQTVPEETTLAFSATAFDTDLPAQTLSFSLSPNVAGPFPDGASITVDGVFSWVPTELQGPGNYHVKIAVSDGVDTAFQDIMIVVIEVNTAPFLNPIGNQTLTQETLAFNVMTTDPDVPSQLLTYSLSACPSGSFPSGSTISQDGQFSWTPLDPVPGTYCVRITVSDGTSEDFEDVFITIAGSGGGGRFYLV